MFDEVKNIAGQVLAYNKFPSLVHVDSILVSLFIKLWMLSLALVKSSTIETFMVVSFSLSFLLFLKISTLLTLLVKRTIMGLSFLLDGRR